MRLMVLPAWFLLAAVAAGCGRSPASPAPASKVVGLTISTDRLALARSDSMQITATANSTDGSQTDVTAIASWQPSAPAIATVAGGVVMGVAPGTTTVAVTYSGWTRTAEVKVRRNVRLVGTVTATDTEGKRGVQEIQVFLDGRNVAGMSTSGGLPVVSAQIGQGDFDTTVVPGEHELRMRVISTYLPNRHILSPATSLQIVDRDNGEVVGTVSLGAKDTLIVLPTTTADLVWTLQIGTYL